MSDIRGGERLDIEATLRRAPGGGHLDAAAILGQRGRTWRS